MTKRLAVSLLSAAVLSGVGAFAEAPSPQSAPSASTTLRVSGTIDKYDASARLLSLSTSNGTLQFPVLSTARIRQGWHKIDALELQKLAGYRAIVRYSESGGDKTVESVHVFGPNERVER